MKPFLNILKKFIRIYLTSYILVHILIFVSAHLISFLISKYSSTEVINLNHVVLLNGMGVMTSFFILVIDKLSLTKLKILFTEREKVLLSKREITQGLRMINLIFSITFSMFILLGTQYILLLFDIKYMFLLAALMLYVFVGFVVVLGVWHGLEILEEKK